MKLLWKLWVYYEVYYGNCGFITRFITETVGLLRGLLWKQWVY
jgi:hypothetical protein